MTKPQIVDSTRIDFDLADGSTLSIYAYAYLTIDETYYATADHYVVRSEGDYDAKRGLKKFDSMLDAISAIRSRYNVLFC